MPRTLIVGDVHGCADELGRLLKKARPTRVVLAGDLFTRGPDPRGVWDLVQSWKAEAVLGNHDLTVMKQWKPGKTLPKQAFRWLGRLPYLLRAAGVLVVHAGVNPRFPMATPRRQALYLRDWNGQRWWRSYRGKRLVVHGHHADCGLIDRRPFTLGLDTGCVSGGRLTGYLV